MTCTCHDMKRLTDRLAGIAEETCPVHPDRFEALEQLRSTDPLLAQLVEATGGDPTTASRDTQRHTLPLNASTETIARLLGGEPTGGDAA